jgi:hypothetical protein
VTDLTIVWMPEVRELGFPVSWSDLRVNRVFLNQALMVRLVIHINYLNIKCADLEWYIADTVRGLALMPNVGILSASHDA